MKKIILVLSVVAGLSISKASAQYVRSRPNFSVGIHIGSEGRRPYNDAVWIGPEWRWEGNNYVEVPGHWDRPRRHHAVWVNGHWQNSRRGYRWVPGHWR